MTDMCESLYSMILRMMSDAAADGYACGFVNVAVDAWRMLDGMAGPDSGHYPTRISITYDTDGDLRQIRLHDDSMGTKLVEVTAEDDLVLDVFAQLETDNAVVDARYRTLAAE